MFEQYANNIQKNTFHKTQESLSRDLLIEESGNISVFYAPFDYVNTSAKIVICGITPGLQQALLALEEAQKQLNSGSSMEQAKHAAKNTASFGGPMRSNLIRLLDYIGIPAKLGLQSSASLFGERADLVHYTSALRYPVFKNSKNYSGTPSMLKKPLLKKQLNTYFFQEIRQLSPDTIYVPLGPKVEEALNYGAQCSALNETQILGGLPHPSGANAERIAYFLGEKPKEALSYKTNPDTLDAAKAQLICKVQSL